MQNLQMTPGQSGGEGQEGQEGGGQQMEDLADSLRQQQELSDQTFRDLQGQSPGDQLGGGGAEGGNDIEGFCYIKCIFACYSKD